jgi:protein involved in polysaccharide export with SLBB domain
MAWTLSLLTAAPPALLAQGFNPSLPQPSPLQPFQQLGSMSPPGQPILTNPNALQPITPAILPCPPRERQPAIDQPSSSERTKQTSDGGKPFSGPPGPMPPSGARAPFAGQRADVVQAPPALESMVPPGRPSSLDLGRAPNGRGLEEPKKESVDPEAPQEDIGALPIEEAFGRFLAQQGFKGELKQFGYDFFGVQFSGFPPVLDMPVGPDYVLGPDDTLSLHIWNSPDTTLNRSYITPVERDGTVFVPQIGSIPVAGSTFSQATTVIRARLGTVLKRFDLHVSMARLRTIKVYVVGEVVRPGAYEISSLATTSHALYAACGPAKSGSLRRIHVVREGTPFATLDFYDFLLSGDRTQDIRLQSGDTLVVPAIGAVAAIGGPVKRPGIYELDDRTTLGRLIELAGGLAPTADRKRCQIFRVEGGRRVMLDVSLDTVLDGSASSPPIMLDGDVARLICVPGRVDNAGKVTGAVRNPGLQEFRPGMRLKDVVTPERLLIDAYMDRAELVRTDPVTYEVTVIPFSPKALFQGKEENVELHRLDKVVIATQVKPPRLVEVSGEVKRPGHYTVESGETLSSLLKRAGGLTVRAFPQGIIVIRESVRRTQQTEIEKFVALQKQKLVVEAANLASGALPTQSGQQISTEQAALQLQLQALDQMAARIQPGRVVVRMESIEQLEGGPEDITLEDGDRITMPQQPQTVMIIGAVRSPTTVVYRDGLKVEDYVQQAGGLTSDAREKDMYILRADGSTDTAYFRMRTVHAGDTVVVPERLEPKTRQLPLWQAIATIIGSAALVAASIAIIGR